MALVQIFFGIILVYVGASASDAASTSSVIFYSVMGMIFLIKGVERL